MKRALKDALLALPENERTVLRHLAVLVDSLEFEVDGILTSCMVPQSETKELAGAFRAFALERLEVALHLGFSGRPAKQAAVWTFLANQQRDRNRVRKLRGDKGESIAGTTADLAQAVIMLRQADTRAGQITPGPDMVGDDDEHQAAALRLTFYGCLQACLSSFALLAQLLNQLGPETAAEYLADRPLPEPKKGDVH